MSVHPRRTGTSLALALVATAILAVPATAATSTTAPTTATEDEPDTVTITVDAEALARLCDERIPAALDRAEDLLDRIRGDADTVGSAAWVRQRAEDAAAAGKDDLARRLEFRAEQRLGHVDEIEALIARLTEVDASVCSQVQP